MLGLCKRTSDSRGLHASFSIPSSSTYSPSSSSSSSLALCAGGGGKGGETAEEETEGTRRQHVPRQRQTARELWSDAKSPESETDDEEEEPRFLFRSLGGLERDMPAVFNI